MEPVLPSSREGWYHESLIYVLISLSWGKGAASRPGPPRVGEVDAQAKMVHCWQGSGQRLSASWVGPEKNPGEAEGGGSGQSVQ